MSRSLMLIILGALVALSPFSGLPMRILVFILPVLGIIAVAIGISYRRQPPATLHEASLPASS